MEQAESSSGQEEGADLAKLGKKAERDAREQLPRLGLREVHAALAALKPKLGAETTPAGDDPLCAEAAAWFSAARLRRFAVCLEKAPFLWRADHFVCKKTSIRGLAYVKLLGLLGEPTRGRSCVPRAVSLCRVFVARLKEQLQRAAGKSQAKGTGLEGALELCPPWARHANSYLQLLPEIYSRLHPVRAPIEVQENTTSASTVPCPYDFDSDSEQAETSKKHTKKPTRKYNKKCNGNQKNKNVPSVATVNTAGDQETEIDTDLRNFATNIMGALKDPYDNDFDSDQDAEINIELSKTHIANVSMKTPVNQDKNRDNENEPIIENVSVAPCGILSSDNENEWTESAVDPLQQDPSGDEPGSKKSVTQLCRALLRRWIELQDETKSRLRGHLRVHTTRSAEDTVVAVDASDEEQNNKDAVIDDDSGRICDDPSTNDDREFKTAFNKIKTALMMLKDKDDIAVGLSAKDVEGIKGDKDELVQRFQTIDITVNSHVPIESKNLNQTSNCDDGKSTSIGKVKNIITRTKPDTGVQNYEDSVQKSLIKDVLTIDGVPKQEIDNKNSRKYVKKKKSKMKVDFLAKKKNIYSKRENKFSKRRIVPEQQEIDKASTIEHVKMLNSKSKVDFAAGKKTICSKKQKIHMKSGKNCEHDNGRESSRKQSHAKDKKLKYSQKICSKSQEVYGSEMLHQKKPKHKIRCDQDHNNKIHSKNHDDKKFKNAIKLVIKNIAALQLSDSIKMAVKEENTSSSRGDEEMGVGRVRNYLFKRTYFKDMVFEHFSEGNDNGKSNIVTSDDTFSTNTKNDSKKDSFDTIRDVQEGVVDVYVMIPSIESNVRQHKVLHGPCPDDNIFEEHHVDENFDGLKSNIIGEHQGKGDAQDPPLNILRDNEVDEYTASPEPKNEILNKELRKIDRSDIVMMVNFDGDDENAGSENCKEIDGVIDKSSNTQKTLDNLSQSTKKKDFQTVGKYSPENKHSKVITSRRTISTTLIKQNHKTINTEKLIIQRDNREKSLSINVNNITRTHASYKGKRKKCDTNTKRKRKRRISCLSDEYFFADNAANENDISDCPDNIAINKRDHMKLIEQEKIDNSHGVNVHISCRNYFSNCSDNNATDKSDHGKHIEGEKSVNNDAVDVDISRRSSCNSASVGLGDVDVKEAAFDPKLLMLPVVVLKKFTDRSFVIDNYNPLRHKSQSLQSTPNSTYRRFSGSKSVKNKRARKISSDSNEDKSEGVVKRVKLPDIEEVRRKNRRMLTAQVTPITHQSGSINAICEHVKSINISRASVGTSPNSCSRCTAQRLPGSPRVEGADAKPRRGAAARARSFITSYAAMQQVKYKPPKIGVEPHHRKRRRRGYLLIESASSDDDSSAMNEDSVRKSSKWHCLKKRRGSPRVRSVSSDDATLVVNVDVVPSDVPRTTPESQCHKKRIQSSDDESCVVDVVSTGELITFEDEENTENNPTSLNPVAQSVPPKKSTSDQNQDLPKLEIATVQNDQDTPRLQSVAAIPIAPKTSSPIVNKDIPTQDLIVQIEEDTETHRLECPTDVTSSSPKAAPSNLNAVVPTQALTEIQKKQEDISVKSVKTGVTPRRKRKRRGGWRFTSPKDISSFLHESEPPPDVFTSENEQEITCNSKPVTNSESVSPIVAHFNQNEGLSQNDQHTINSLKRITSSPPDASALNVDEATQDLTSIQKEQNTHRRKRQRRSGHRFKSPDDDSSVPDECEPTQDLSLEGKQNTTIEPIIHSPSSPRRRQSHPDKAASSVIDKRVSYVCKSTRDLITFKNDKTTSMQPVLSNAAVSALNNRETTRELTTIRTKRKTDMHSSSKRVERFASVSSVADVPDERSKPDPTTALNIKTRSSKLITQSVSTTSDPTDPNKNVPTGELTTSQNDQPTTASEQISRIASVPSSPAPLTVLSDDDTTRELVEAPGSSDSESIPYDEPIILSDDDPQNFTMAPSDMTSTINPGQSVLNDNTLAKLDSKRNTHAPSIFNATILATQDDVVKALKETTLKTQSITQDDIVKDLKGSIITTQNVDVKACRGLVLATQKDVVKPPKRTVLTTQKDVIKALKGKLITQDAIVKTRKDTVLVTQDDVVKALTGTVLTTKDNVAKTLKGPVPTTQDDIVKTCKSSVLATEDEVVKALKGSVPTTQNIVIVRKGPVLATQQDVVTPPKRTVLTTQEDVVKALKGTVLTTKDNVAKALKSPVPTTQDDIVKTRKGSVLATQENVIKALKGPILTTQNDIVRTLKETVLDMQDDVVKALKGSVPTTQDIVIVRKGPVSATQKEIVKPPKHTILTAQEDVVKALKGTVLTTKENVAKTVKGPVPTTQDDIVKTCKSSVLATQDEVVKALKGSVPTTQNIVIVRKGPVLATQQDVVTPPKRTILTAQENVIKALKGTELTTKNNVAKALKSPVPTTHDDIVKTRKGFVLATQEDVVKALKGPVLTTQDDIVRTLKETVLNRQDDVVKAIKGSVLTTKDNVAKTVKGSVPTTQDDIENLRGTAWATQDEVVEALKGTTLATQDDVAKAQRERRKSTDCNRDPIISALPSPVQRQIKSKFGFKPLLYRLNAVPSAPPLKESAVVLAQDEQETCTDRQNEVVYSKTVEDDGNLIDREIEKDRAGSIAQPLTEDNGADVAVPFSEVVSDIHVSNVPDIGEGFDNQAMVAPDEFCPVIVSVRSLAPQQELTNESNLQTQTTTVQPDPTITSKQAEPVYLTSDNVQQVTPDDATENSAVSTDSPKVVACVIRVPSAQSNPNKDQSGARVSGSKDKAPLTVITLKRAKIRKRARVTYLTNSSSDVKDLLADSPVVPQKITHLRRIVNVKRVISIPPLVQEQMKIEKRNKGPISILKPTSLIEDLKQMKIQKRNKRPISILKPRSLIEDLNESQVTAASSSLRFRKILPKVISVSDIQMLKETNPSNVATLAPKSKPSNLPKITLNRAEPVYASYQNSFQSLSHMEEVQEETNLPRVVDVTGDLHVMQPDSQMGLHIVVSQPDVTSDVSFSNINQIHTDDQRDDQIGLQYVVPQEEACADNSLPNTNQVNTEEAVVLSDAQIGLINLVDVSTSNDNSLTNINRLDIDDTVMQSDDGRCVYLVIPPEPFNDSSPSIHQNDTDVTVMPPGDLATLTLVRHEEMANDSARTNPNDIAENSNNPSKTSNVVPRRIVIKRRPSVPMLVRSVMSGRRESMKVQEIDPTGAVTTGERGMIDQSCATNYRTVEDWLSSGCAATVPSTLWARGRPQDSLVLLCVGPAVWATRGPRPYLLLSERAPPPPVFALWTVSPRQGLELPHTESYSLAAPPRKIVDDVAYQKVSDDPVTYAKLLVAVADARACRGLLQRGAPLQMYCLQTCQLYPLRAETSPQADRAAPLPSARWDVSDAQFLAQHRLPRDRAKALVEELRPLLPPMELGDMEPDEKVLTCLSFLASGSSPGSVGACAAVAQVADALNQDEIYKVYVHFPETRKERADIKRKFYEQFKLPGVLGAMAGLHVPVMEPGDDEQDCFNGVFHSINVQVICDADRRILSVDCGHGGGTHSCAAWLQHQLNHHLDFFRKRGEKVCLLGDSSYPQQESTLTPAEEHERYQAAHAQAHAVVGDCVDALRARWRCLSTASETTAPTQAVAATIVRACAVLHNIAKDVELPADEEFTRSERRVAASVAAAQGTAAGYLASRGTALAAGRRLRAVARQLDKEAKKTRNALRPSARPPSVLASAPDMGELIEKLRRGRFERARLAACASADSDVLDDDDD